jgi:hypothetical protein
MREGRERGREGKREKVKVKVRVRKAAFPRNDIVIRNNCVRGGEERGGKEVNVGLGKDRG